MLAYGVANGEQFNAMLRAIARLDLPKIGFDGVQVAEHIWEMNRIQVLKVTGTVPFENRVDYCVSNLGADFSSGVLNIDDPVLSFRFCHCLTLHCLSAPNPEWLLQSTALPCTGIFVANELQDRSWHPLHKVSFRGFMPTYDPFR